MNSLIQHNIPLADKNWFRTGGPAKYYCEPQSELEFQEALVFAREHNLEIFVLGEGANILISDEGFDGLVIKPKLKEIYMNGIYVTAQAGISMHDLILYCLDHNILGLEEFSGIPGTVGGSVYINLHYFEFLIAQFLVSARVINKKTGQVETVNTDWFEFGYDHSKLHAHEYYLIDATFKLRAGTDLDVAYARGRRIEIIRHRQNRYPKQGTCGSFFRNFHDHEVTLMSNDKKMIYVAYYLDKIGVKGALRIGDAQVSYQHANMLVNTGSATTNDLIAVARKMQKLVLKQFGVLPQPECELVGFNQNPLL